jgi:hypothetical protein
MISRDKAIENNFEILTEIQRVILDNPKNTLGDYKLKCNAYIYKKFVKNINTSIKPFYEFKLIRSITIKDVKKAYREYDIYFKKRQLGILNDKERFLTVECAIFKNKNKFKVSNARFIAKFLNDKVYNYLYEEYKENDFHHRYKPKFFFSDKSKDNKLKDLMVRQKEAPKFNCTIRYTRPSMSYKERPVSYTNDKGKVINFKSVSEAARQMCINSVNIVHAASKQHQTAGGYIWDYTDGKDKAELIKHNKYSNMNINDIIKAIEVLTKVIEVNKDNNDSLKTIKDCNKKIEELLKLIN